MPKTRYTSNKPSYQKMADHSTPPMGSIAVFEWETFSPLRDFSDQSMIEVFKRISSDIIERPYHYDEHKAFDAQGEQIKYPFTMAGNSEPPKKIPGVAVYKQNHGTGHAIRQMFYTDILIDIIAVSGNTKGRDIVKKINSNPEVKSIIKLAAYCKRIGRTLDHEHDPGQTTIYSKRSSEMFVLMAKELGYKADLIQAIGESMLEPIPIGLTPLSGKTIVGINGTDLRDFSESVLMAAHMADLSRLFQVKRKHIQKSLQDYFDPSQLSTISTELVEMACKANAMTGNRVVKQEEGVRHIITPLNGKKLVEVVNNIDQVVKDLSQLRLVAPSVHPIVSPEPQALLSTKSISAAFTDKTPLKKVANFTVLDAHEKKFTDHLKKLNVKVKELKDNAIRHPQEYTVIAKKMGNLHDLLTKIKDDFFLNPNDEAFETFNKEWGEAIDSVEQEADRHRGWHRVNPILRAIVGILAAISVIPGLVVAKESKNGFMQTFFARPKTDTQQKLLDFKQQFQDQVEVVREEITACL